MLHFTLQLHCAWFSSIAENFKPIIGGTEWEEQESISNNDKMDGASGDD